jgi:hypothetical protein
MAIKLFNRKSEEDVFVTLDRMMGEMASTEIYIEYLELREGM